MKIIIIIIINSKIIKKLPHFYGVWSDCAWRIDKKGNKKDSLKERNKEDRFKRKLLRQVEVMME